MEQTNLPVKYGKNTKRAALLRIVRDLQRFNEEQLKILISMAHKVRRSKIQLSIVAAEAEAMMNGIPYRSGVKAENEAIEGKKEEEPEIISSGSLLDHIS